MSTAVIIVIIILVLVATVLIAASSLDNKYIIERDIVIGRPKAVVFNYIKFLKNQENYNKWVMADPLMSREYRGTDGTAGFVYAWDSKNKQVGKGEQEIKSIKEGESIGNEIRFVKPFEGTSYAKMTTVTAAANQTKVSWYFSGKRTYAMKIVHLLFNLKKMLGKDIDTSLANLKAILEK